MRLDTGFRPSRHSFAFTNRWRDTLFGVLKSRGRCGGMVFAALDLFLAGEPVPNVGTDPAHDSAMARHIARRQLDSIVVGLGVNLWRFALLTYLPTAAHNGIAPRTRRELLRVFDLLRAGRPVPLGLVSSIGLRTLVRNHQVLAYAAEFEDDAVVVWIYDPNHPKRDDVFLEVSLGDTAPVIEHAGTRASTWRGFFVETYRSSARRA